MKKPCFLAIAAAIALLNSCTNRTPKGDDGFIKKDSANKMIQSYLTSIADNSDSADTNLYNLTLDAGTLRTYLEDKSIKNVKVMFAHTLEYINSGHGGQPAGYKSGAFTIVLAGYDESGNYVYFPDYMAINHATPCPRNCTVEGSASSNLLQ